MSRESIKQKLRSAIEKQGFVDRDDLAMLIEIIPDELHRFGRPPTVDEVLELLK